MRNSPTSHEVPPAAGSEVDRSSVAYHAGMAARRAGIPIHDTQIRVLRIGSERYEQFLAGYDAAAQCKSFNSTGTTPP